jgi:hypothetical protein
MGVGMTEAETTGAGARRGPSTRPPSFGTPVDPAADWVRFGAVIMVVVGAFSAVEGVIALVTPDTYVTFQGAVLAIDLAVWAWVHIILGMLVFLSGLGLLRNAESEWARVAGVTVVGLSMLMQLGWLSAAPIWSIIMIVLDLLVLRALVVIGGERAVGRR